MSDLRQMNPMSSLKKEAIALLAGSLADHIHLQRMGTSVDKITAHDKAVDALKAAKTDDELKNAIKNYRQARVG